MSFDGFEKKWLTTAVVVSAGMLALFAVSLFLRRVNGDEGIIGEWAYWLAKDGTARSMLYFSYFGEKAYHLPIYHKFYTLLLAGFVKVFGFELFSIRILSLVSFLGLIWLMHAYLGRQQISRFSLLLLAGFLLSQSLMFNYAFMGRPELMMALMAFGTFLSTQQYIKTGKWQWALLSGVVSGLSFYAHLNGIAIIGAAGLLTLVHFRWKAVLVFGLAAFTLASLFVLDIPGAHLGLLRELAQAPDVKNSSFSIGRLIMKVLSEHERFFHNTCLVLFSSATILSLVFTWKNQRKYHTDLLLFTLFLVLSMSLFTHGKTAKYLLFYMPFMGLMVLQALHYLFSERKIKQILVLSVLLLASSLVASFDYLKDHAYFVSVSERNAAMSQHLNVGSTVLAHDAFVFGQIERFEIRSPIIFFFTHDGFMDNDADDCTEYLSFAQEQAYDFVAIDLLLERNDLRKMFTSANFKTGDRLSGFEVTYRDAEFLIFKNIEQ